MAALTTKERIPRRQRIRKTLQSLLTTRGRSSSSSSSSSSASSDSHIDDGMPRGWHAEDDRLSIRSYPDVDPHQPASQQPPLAGLATVVRGPLIPTRSHEVAIGSVFERWGTPDEWRACEDVLARGEMLLQLEQSCQATIARRMSAMEAELGRLEFHMCVAGAGVADPMDQRFINVGQFFALAMNLGMAWTPRL